MSFNLNYEIGTSFILDEETSTVKCWIWDLNQGRMALVLRTHDTQF